MKRLSIPLIIVLIAGTACWPFSDDALPDMSVKRLSGRVDVLRDGEVLSVEGEMSIQPGDVVRTTGAGSQARLRLQGDRFARLKDNARAEVVNDSSLESLVGSLLTEATEPTKVGFEEVEAAVNGSIFRIDRGFASAKAATYGGAPVRLESRGQPSLELRPLYQVSVSTTDLPSSATPYQLRMDVWDGIYLDEIVELEDQLKGLGRGLSSQLDSKPTVDYFSGLAGGRDARFVRGYIKRASSVNLLIGFSVALNDERRSLPSAFRKAFELFETGARWGIVAAIMGVDSRPLLADLEDIVRASRVVAGGEEVDLTSAAAGERAASGEPGDPTEPGEPKPNPTHTGTVEPTPDPTPSESPDPCDRLSTLPECLFSPPPPRPLVDDPIAQ